MKGNSLTDISDSGVTYCHNNVINNHANEYEYKEQSCIWHAVCKLYMYLCDPPETVCSRGVVQPGADPGIFDRGFQ